MITCSELAFTHEGSLTGFFDVTFEVRAGTTAALVGDNGVGKTTLLRLLAGELAPDAGSATTRGTTAYMPQEVGFGQAASSVVSLLGSFAPAPLDHIAAGIREATGALEAGDDRAGIRLAELLARWGDLGGYELEKRWDEACQTVLGFGLDQAETRTAASLSGGERKQLVLDVLLRSPFEVLLLDEPDNYLDIPAKIQLEQRLRDSDKTILLVSHDRDLLRSAVTRIVTVERAGAWVHHGSYADYDAAYEKRQIALGDERRRWEDEEQRLRDLVRILKERARYSDVFAPKARAAESRWKRFTAAGPPPLPPPPQKVSMHLIGRDSGRRILKIAGLAVPGLVHPFDEEIRIGDRIGVVGPNGTGKTQLLRALDTGAAHDDPGPVLQFGSGVDVGFFRQVTEDPALVGRTPLQVVEDSTGNRERTMASLARYGLAPQAHQDYATLSGGQKARLAILLLELAGTNLLLLDEPTDNLDIASSRSLEAALVSFRGAIVAVSHDRTFLRSMQRFLHLDDQGRIDRIDDLDSVIQALEHGPASLPPSHVKRLSTSAT